MRRWATNLLTLLVLVYVVAMIVMVMYEAPAEVDPQGKVLILSPEGLILDQEAFPSYVSNDKQTQSRDLIRTIRAAAADERLAAVLIDFSKADFAGAALS